MGSPPRNKAKALELKAKSISCTTGEIKNAALPAIARGKDGNYFVLAKIARSDKPESDEKENKFLIHDLRESAPKILSETEFVSLWSNELIYIGRRPTSGSSCHGQGIGAQGIHNTQCARNRIFLCHCIRSALGWNPRSFVCFCFSWLDVVLQSSLDRYCFDFNSILSRPFNFYCSDPKASLE